MPDSFAHLFTTGIACLAGSIDDLANAIRAHGHIDDDAAEDDTDLSDDDEIAQIEAANAAQ